VGGPSPSPPGRRGFLLAFLAAALAGCGPQDPLELKVRAGSEIDFDMWRTHALDRLSREQMADFNEALQQIKFQIMATHSARGAGVGPLALETIDGETVREVLRRGLSWELRCLESERESHVRAMRANARYVPDADDVQAVGQKADLLIGEVDSVNEEGREISRVTERLDAAALPTGLPPMSDEDLETPVAKARPAGGNP
jgi:hypothetical protein